MASAALTPELALDYLAELSTDVRAATLLAPDGSLAAVRPDDPEMREVLVAATHELLSAARRAAGPEREEADAGVGEVEVRLPAGAVFAVSRGAWTVAVVAGREALSSLTRFDLGMILADLQGAGGGQGAEGGGRGAPRGQAAAGDGRRVARRRGAPGAGTR